MGPQDQVEPAGTDETVQLKLADAAESQVDQEPVGAGAMAVGSTRILVHSAGIGLADMHQHAVQFAPSENGIEYGFQSPGGTSAA